MNKEVINRWLSMGSNLWISLLVLSLGFSTSVAAQANANDRQRALDRATLALTGQDSLSLFGPDTIADFRASRVSASDLIDRLQRDYRFQKYFAQYWVRVLKVTDITNFKAFLNETTKRELERDLAAAPPNTPGTGRYLKYEGMQRCNAPLYNLEILASTGSAKIQCPLNTNCDCATWTKEVTPYWDTARPIRIYVDVDKEEFCGANLGKCFPDLGQIDDQNKYFVDIAAAISMEPGMLIARTVSEDLSWNNVVLSRRGMVNGVYADFLKRFADRLRNLAPPGNFPTNEVNRLSSKLAITDLDRWDWMVHGSEHAGILTTMGFAAYTNGRRAKANRTMESLLCRSFTVPPDIQPIPSTETDLTKKPYCSSCHVTLEPMSNFFGRWPASTNNYFFTAGAGAAGRFDGKAGDGEHVFGQILVESPYYATCAVQRGFEFVMGRAPNRDLDRTAIKELTQEFEANGRKLWPILKALILKAAKLEG